MEQHNDEMFLKELIEKAKECFSYILSQWIIILLAVIFGALLGFSYAFSKKFVYTATLTFALEDEKSGGSGGLGALAGSFGVDFDGSGGGVFSGANLNELFKSRSMVQKALLTEVVYQEKRMSLAEMYINLHHWRDSWNKSNMFKKIQFLPNSDPQKFTRIQDSIMGKMYIDITSGILSVSQKDKKVSITSIDVKSDNELFALYFNESITKVVSDFYVSTKSKKARENMAILSRQTDSIRRELNSAITGVAVANDNTFNLNPALNVRRVPSARRQVDVQANTAILTELVRQTELAKVALRRETPLIQVIDRPILPLMKEKFGKSKGILLGGILAGFLTVLFLIFKRVFKIILN